MVDSGMAVLRCGLPEGVEVWEEAGGAEIRFSVGGLGAADI